MPIAQTVEETARDFRVSEKTVRTWIREGLPVVKSGAKGAGQGAMVDAARAVAWVSEKRGRAVSSWTRFLQQNPTFPANPLREVAEIYAELAPHVVAVGLKAWFTEPAPGDNRPGWAVAGLSESQARGTVFETFSMILLMLSHFKTSQFEKEVEKRAAGADLDDLASILLGGDIRSRWRDGVKIPSAMGEFMAPSDLATYAECAAHRADQLAVNPTGVHRKCDKSVTRCGYRLRLLFDARRQAGAK